MEKPPIEFLNHAIQQAAEETEAAKAMQQLAEAMREAEGLQFEECLIGVNSLFQKGYSSVFMTYSDLMRKMMNHFTKLGRLLEVLIH